MTINEFKYTLTLYKSHNIFIIQLTKKNARSSSQIRKVKKCANDFYVALYRLAGLQKEIWKIGKTLKVMKFAVGGQYCERGDKGP